MTPEEHARMQELEGLVKRYRSRIVELKSQLESERDNSPCTCGPDQGCSKCSTAIPTELR